jgi:hypothetical protein
MQENEYGKKNEINQSKIDVEAELAKILQEEIWKEITATTGETQADLDSKIIKQIVKLHNDRQNTTR